MSKSLEEALQLLERATELLRQTEPSEGDKEILEKILDKNSLLNAEAYVKYIKASSTQSK